MGIDNIDDLKPDGEVEEIYPEFPKVRCTVCGTVYEINTEVQRSSIHLVKGDCPKCHSQIYNTHIARIPGGYNPTHITIDEATNFTVELDSPELRGFKLLEIKDE